MNFFLIDDGLGALGPVRGLEAGVYLGDLGDLLGDGLCVFIFGFFLLHTTIMVKDCGPDRIRNPKSNRCVSRTGRIGKALLLKSSSPDYDNDGFITNEALRRNAERVVKGMRKEGTLNDWWRKAQHIDYNTVPLRWSSTPSRSSTPKSSIASNSSPRSTLQGIPLTMKQVVAQLPKFTPRTYDLNINERRSPLRFLEYARSKFGKHVQYLTPSLAKKLIGKRVVFIYGQHWVDGSVGDNLSPMKILGMNENGIFVDSDEMPDDEEWIYWDDTDHAATGSGSDPVFVFVK